MAAPYFSGTSGIVLPVPNKQSYPEAFKEKSRLAYYASLFNSLEVNSSFYKIPMGITVERWGASVPDDFRFTFKLFKGITHSKTATDDDALTAKFMQVINRLGAKKGCLLVQFPRGSSFDHSRLENLLSVINAFNPPAGWQVCVEFRHERWYNDDSYALLKRHHCGMVIHDMKTSVPPLVDPWVDFVYLRFHGPEDNFRGSYDDAFLRQHALRIRRWRKAGKTVYAYFNNTLGDALNNLVALNQKIRR